VSADQKLTITEGKSSSIQPQGKLTTNWGRIKNTRLFQNYPNPFNPETWIPFQLAEDSNVKIRIMDISGKVIRTINLGDMKAGTYTSKELSAHWDGKTDSGETVSSGLYFCELQIKGFNSIVKMVVSR